MSQLAVRRHETGGRTLFVGEIAHIDGNTQRKRDSLFAAISDSESSGVSQFLVPCVARFLHIGSVLSGRRFCSGVSVERGSVVLLDVGGSLRM